MIGKRNIGNVAAIGGSAAAIVLLTGLLAARADELADLRANMELLQKLIDQLAQAPPAQYAQGALPEAKAGPGQPVVAGSFPRSFLIPGTDTSIRIGGFAQADVLYYIKGAQTSGQLNGQGGINNQTFYDGQGGTGNLPSIPLNNSINHSKSSAFDISPRTSRLLFDARTPTAYGEVDAYIEFDFAYNNTNVNQSNASSTAQAFYTRLRKAYGTFAGFEAGVDTSILHDSDADPELADFGGGATSAGRSRQTELKYTYAGPYGTIFTAGLENPEPQFSGPFGAVQIDTNQIPNIAACSVTGNTAANLPADTACLGNQAFFSPLVAAIPEFIGTARINQPWGHVQLGAVVRTDRFNDGQFFERTYMGFGGALTGDTHPFSGTPGPLGKDDFGFTACLGQDTGNQCNNGTGPVTNFGAPILVPGLGPGGSTVAVNPLTSAAWNTANSLTRQLYDGVVRTSPSGSYGGQIWYQHWWTNELRSTLEFSGIYNALNTSILGVGNTNNKILAMGHANLYWSPVAFVDFGAEYAYGHRVTVANFKGDAYTLEGLMRVRF